MCPEMVLIRVGEQDEFLTTPLGRVGIPQGLIWSRTMYMYEEITENVGEILLPYWRVTTCPRAEVGW